MLLLRRLLSPPSPLPSSSLPPSCSPCVPPLVDFSASFSFPVAWTLQKNGVEKNLGYGELSEFEKGKLEKEVRLIHATDSATMFAHMHGTLRLSPSLLPALPRARSLASKHAAYFPGTPSFPLSSALCGIRSSHHYTHDKHTKPAHAC